MADAPESANQKVLLAGFAVAFLAVALVLFLMLRGGSDEAADPGVRSTGEAAGPRPTYKAPPNMKPNQVQRAIEFQPAPALPPSPAPAAAPVPAAAPAPSATP